MAAGTLYPVQGFGSKLLYTREQGLARVQRFAERLAGLPISSRTGQILSPLQNIAPSLKLGMQTLLYVWSTNCNGKLSQQSQISDLVFLVTPFQRRLSRGELDARLSVDTSNSSSLARAFSMAAGTVYPVQGFGSKLLYTREQGFGEGPNICPKLAGPPISSRTGQIFRSSPKYCAVVKTWDTDTAARMKYLSLIHI